MPDLPPMLSQDCVFNPEGTNLTDNFPDSSQIHKIPDNDNTHQMQTRVKIEIFKPKALNVQVILLIPDLVKEAMRHSKRVEAMEKEKKALLANDIWVSVPTPPRKKNRV